MEEECFADLSLVCETIFLWCYIHKLKAQESLEYFSQLPKISQISLICDADIKKTTTTTTTTTLGWTLRPWPCVVLDR